MFDSLHNQVNTMCRAVVSTWRRQKIQIAKWRKIGNDTHILQPEIGSQNLILHILVNNSTQFDTSCDGLLLLWSFFDSHPNKSI